MFWSEIINEGSDYNCPNCDEYLGKDTEVGNPAYCGNCGDTSPNPRGHKAPAVANSTNNGVEFAQSVDSGYTFIGMKKDGRHIGSVYQYGPDWFEFDNYNWVARLKDGTLKTFDANSKQAAIDYIISQS